VNGVIAQAVQRHARARRTTGQRDWRWDKNANPVLLIDMDADVPNGVGDRVLIVRA
jgi:hypothetical protein